MLSSEVQRATVTSGQQGGNDDNNNNLGVSTKTAKRPKHLRTAHNDKNRRSPDPTLNSTVVFLHVATWPVKYSELYGRALRYATNKSRSTSHKSFRTNTIVETGASTPYKRWSKCTMEKVGGSVFAET